MHHHRRKSGHGHNTSTPDVRTKTVTASDPATKHKRPSMPRRHTPMSAQKLGRSHREREREFHDTWENERESFPQYCMTCEKQFVPSSERHLYCSDGCRRVDQNSAARSVHVDTYSMDGTSSYLYSDRAEPKDIVPRASPSRPNSMLFGQSPPASPGTTLASHHSHALSALRSLTIRPPSPPSPSGSHSGGLWPFTRSMAASPSSSYARPSAPYLASTYDGGHNYNAGGYAYDSGPTGLDRPLPVRHPGTYSRPRSIELVTPVLGR